jgi:NADP-dependent 3-hydroxy acid dehydrogenase YdfG
MNTFTSSRERKVVLLTGASAGLGLSLAKLLAPRNFRLILTAREASLPRLAELGFENSDHLWIRPLDVTSRAQRENLIEEARQRWNGVDMLIGSEPRAKPARVKLVPAGSVAPIGSITKYGTTGVTVSMAGVLAMEPVLFQTTTW